MEKLFDSELSATAALMSVRIRHISCVLLFFFLCIPRKKGPLGAEEFFPVPAVSVPFIELNPKYEASTLLYYPVASTTYTAYIVVSHIYENFCRIHVGIEVERDLLREAASRIRFIYSNSVIAIP